MSRSRIKFPKKNILTIILCILIVILFTTAGIIFNNKYSIRIGDKLDQKLRQTSKESSTLKNIATPIAQKHVITSIVPSEMKIGQRVTFKGYGFGKSTGWFELHPLQATIAGVHAKIISWSDVQFTIEVPEVPFPDEFYYILTSTGYNNGETWGYPIHTENPQSARQIEIIPDVVYYNVKPGDTLIKIAREQLKNGGRYLEIITLNQKQYPSLISSSFLEPGTTLRLPKK